MTPCWSLTRATRRRAPAAVALGWCRLPRTGNPRQTPFPEARRLESRRRSVDVLTRGHPGARATPGRALRGRALFVVVGVFHRRRSRPWPSACFHRWPPSLLQPHKILLFCHHHVDHRFQRAGWRGLPLAMRAVSNRRLRNGGERARYRRTVASARAHDAATRRSGLRPTGRARSRRMSTRAYFPASAVLRARCAAGHRTLSRKPLVCRPRRRGACGTVHKTAGG